MKDIQIGFSTGCFYRQPILETLDTIAQNSFTIIEISSSRPHMDYTNADEVRRIGDQIGRLGLRPISFHAPYGHHIDITHPDENLRRSSEEAILQAADAAAALGAEYYVLHPGPEIPYTGDVPERHHRIGFGLEVLCRVSAFCRRRGIKLLLENMLPHLFLGYMHSMFHVYDMIDPPPSGFCMDTGHGHLTGHLEKVLDLMSGRALLVHASDNHGHGDDHLPPGRGGIQWEPFLRHLQHTGFKGTVVLELACQPGRSVEQTLREACCSRDMLKEIMDRL